jgi:ribosomal protein S18 acetylase RimI-like enzyme
VIVAFAPAHVEAVARLHCARLTGLLTRLGLPAARAYYAACAQTAEATGFVVLEDGIVRGFVLGSARPAFLREAVQRMNPLRLSLAVAWGVLRRPASLMSLLRSRKGPDEGSYDPSDAELTYLAVSAEAEGSGAAAMLVAAFTRAIREAGLPSVALSVDDGNLRAIAFYERLGFRREGSYREFGTLHHRYRLESGGAAAETPAPGGSA